MRQLLLALTVCVAATALADDTYEVARFYERETLPRDAKVIDNFDNIKDAKYLLVPIELEKGVYEVTVTREAADLYKAEVGYNDVFYIETKYCYKYCHRSRAVLIVNGRYDYKKSKLVFE